MTEAATAIPTSRKATRDKAKRSPKKEGGLFAVIATGGKQYRVQAGDILKIEKLSDSAKASTDKQGWKEGGTITFDSVLMIDNGASEITLGNPFIKDKTVTGTLKRISRYKTVDVIKYKQKSRYFKKYGHRQPYFEVQIDSIK
ncbi:MAG: 50S ribosomal protein L21 [Patescibacteria group bacterium]